MYELMEILPKTGLFPHGFYKVPSTAAISQTVRAALLDNQPKDARNAIRANIQEFIVNSYSNPSEYLLKEMEISDDTTIYYAESLENDKDNLLASIIVGQDVTGVAFVVYSTKDNHKS